MRAVGFSITVIGIYDPQFNGDEYASLPAWRRWEQADSAHAYLITDLDDPLRTYWDVRERVDAKDRVLVPRVLGLDAAIRADN